MARLRFIVLACVLATAPAVAAYAQATRGASTEPPAALSPQDWHEDLRALAAAIATRHKDAFTVVSRDRFKQAVDEIDARLDSLTDWQRYVEFKRLTAMVGDAHTNLDDSKGRLPRRYYPFSVLPLRDGVWVTATTPELRSLLGQRITRIGSTDMDEAIERIGQIVPHENQVWLRHQARAWINAPDALEAIGLIDDIDRAQFTFSDASGVVSEMFLRPMEKGQGQSPAPELRAERLPMTLRPRPGGAIFGSTMLPDSRDLYVWYDSCSDMKDKTVAEFSREVLDATSRDKPQRLIIDLRRNGGGNSALIAPLVLGLKQMRDAGVGPQVFAIIGANTFSSGLWAAEDLKRAGVTLVGTPTGGRPNSFGEVRTFQLPHSGFTLYYSTKKWTRDPEGDPDSLEPEILAEPTYADLIAGRDVAIDAVRGRTGN